MEWEGRQESSNVEDRRRFGGRTGLAIGGGAGLLILIVGLILGVDPSKLAEITGGGQQGVQHGQADPQEERFAKFTKVIFHDTEEIWDEQFRKMGRQYQKPVLVLFTGRVESACGSADSAVGPFYCPGDQKVYIDLSFYRDMEKKLNAPGEFARAYVIAHEVGHHVQHLLGYSEKARKRESDKHKSSVRLELQADYLAGVWAYHGQRKYKFLDPKDIPDALHAAFEIGDDRLQKKARGYVVPDSFTHGTSAQRMYWFKKGFDTGDVAGADALIERQYDALKPPPGWQPK